MTRFRMIACALALTVAASGTALAGDAKGEKAAEKGHAAQDLARAMDAKDKPAVCKALEALAAEGGAKAAETIISVALRLDQLSKFPIDQSNDIFDAAEQALANVKDAAGEKVIYDHLEKHKDVKVRIFLTDVVAKKKADEAEDALVKAIGDKSPLVQKNAIQHLGIRQSKKAFDPIIELLAKVEKKREDPWLDCLRFLTTLTGQQFATAEEWKGWWLAKKDTFDPKKTARSQRSNASGVGETISRDAPKLFGTEVLSKKCVFVLDTSGSMKVRDTKAEPGKPSISANQKDPNYADIPEDRERMHRLREAMVKLIEALPSDTKFTIVTFATSVREFSGELMDASASNKEKAIDFARGMQPDGFTITDEAMRRAFEIPDANTIYLFSDGVPQRGKNADGSSAFIDTKAILEEVEQMNRIKKIKIFTIGIGEADAKFMAALAGQHGGTFTPVE